MKLDYFEFIDMCMSGQINEIKLYMRSHETLQSVSYFYGLKKLLRVPSKIEPANTKFFSPLLHSIFYDKPDVIDYLVKHDLVNGFSNLKEPPQAFVEDDDEDDGNAADGELGISDD